MRCRFLPVTSLAAIALAVGCKPKEDIQVYQAPRDVASAPAPAAAPRETRTEAGTPPARPPWTVPDGWGERPATGGMRIATYGVTTADGRTMDVSVVPLGGQTDTRLDSVNLWRTQAGLGPLSEADLAAHTQPVRIGETEGDLYDLVSEQPLIDGKFKVRTLAAILSLGSTTVFFKATGEDALVTENKPKFLAWLKSVQTGPTPAPSATGGPVPADMRGPVAPPPSTALPQWEIPSGWKSAPASTMRLASFVVEGAGGQTGDLSVVALGPAAGGVLANVNRWRGQLGLGPLDEADLAKTTSTVESTAGDQAIIVDLAGDGPAAGKRVLAAIVPRPDRTWFYKLTGDDGLVAGQKASFVSFIKSVKYP